ncbi:TonB-dependent receptor [Granulicella rosea]|nr:carboxypeptidase regulatory-like domain-containing protein [Granulicella rosea]
MAQNSSSIEGVITDATGAAVGGATVTVRNTDTGITRTVKTDAAGRYSVTALGNGSYAISAVAANFSTTSLTGVKLDISQTLKEDIALTVGGASDQVSVEAAALSTETETSSNGQTLDQKSVAELPLANRQFYNLVEVAPGVVPPAQASSMGFRGGMNINGAPETTNLFVVNGTWNIDMGTNQDSFRPSVDTIAEFKVLSGNYSAEYGRLQGGQILITTKQGSNKLHGSIYEFIRNGAIEAKPWSSSVQTVTPAFKQNTFGATLGAPILKDKAFVFVGYEGQRIRQQAVAVNQVPTTWTAAGCLPGTVQAYDPLTGTPLTRGNTGACAGAPGQGYDLTALSEWTGASAQLGRLMESLAYPNPNIATALNPTSGGFLAAATSDYNFSETRKETMDEVNSRVDYKMNDHNSFYESYNYFHDPSFEPSNSLCATRNMPNFGCFTNQTSQLANIGWIHIFPGSNLINDARAGFQRLVQPRVQEDNTTIGSKWPGFSGQLGQTAVANNYGLPSITVSGNYTTTGGQTNLPQDRWDDHFQFIDTLTWSHKSHTFKAGIDTLWTNTTEYEVSNGRGALTFNPATLASTNASSSCPKCGTTGDPIGDILLGFPSATSVTPSAPNIYNNYRSVDLFLLDDWKVRKNLTLNLGLRWEIDPPVVEKNGSMITFSPSSPNQLYPGASNQTVGFSNPNSAITTAKQTGNRSVYHGDYNNVAPRVGFAWQPFNNEKTVIKGAYGVFFTSPEMFNEFLSYSLGYPVRYAKTYAPAPVSASGQITLANPFPNDLPTPGSPYCVAGASTGCTTPNPSIAGCASPCGLIPVITSTEVDPKFATPYVQQWTLGVQRQLTRNTIFEALYFGNKGSKLSYGTAAVLNPNANPDADTLGQNYTQSTSATTGYTTYSAVGAAALQALRVYPQWGAIGIHKTGFNSFYHSLQSRVQTSTKNGTSILVSYTYAKAEDELTSAQNPINQHGDKGLSVFNVKHRLVVSPVVPLPFGKGQPWLNNGLGSAIFGGFQLSGIWQYFGGRPFPITDSTNQSSSAGGGDRPDVIVGQNPNGYDSANASNIHNAKEWFNIHAFAYNPPGTYGTAAPNMLIGPGWDEVDLTFGRTFSVRDWAKVQFKVDAFNIANHPNLMNPSASFAGSPGYNPVKSATTGAYTYSTGFTSLAYPTQAGYCTTNTTTVANDGRAIGCTAPGSFGTITAANNMREIQASIHVSF